MTQLMGILNLTPDSFYDGGRFDSFEKAILQGHQLWKEGADLIDIGGESSRPGAKEISQEEELKRVIPLIKQLQREVPIPLSIDTTKPTVAAKALEAGASVLNDIGGFENPEMWKIAADSGATLCIMHMQGIPRTMQHNPHYPKGVIEELLDWFSQKIALLLDAGVKENQMLLDPGIGFGKTIAHNLEILHNLPQFKKLGRPLLIGTSRKSFIYKSLGKAPEDVLPATLAVNTLAIEKGVDWIRVHDVAEHRQIIDFMKKEEKC